MQGHAHELIARGEELERAGDYVTLANLLLDVLGHQPSPGVRHFATGMATRIVDQALNQPRDLVKTPGNLSVLDALLDREEVAARGGIERDPLQREVWLLQGLARLGEGDRTGAASYFVRAAAPVGEAPSSSAPDAGEHIRTLCELLARGYPVFEHLFRTGASESSPASFFVAVDRLLGRLQSTSAPLAFDGPGQCGVLLYLAVPRAGIEVGRLSKVNVSLDPKGPEGIEMAPAFAERARGYSEIVRRELDATARQAYEVATGLFPGRRVRATWDLDASDTPVEGGSLGLSLALAILSAVSGRTLPEGLAATGVLNSVGGVTRVKQLSAKSLAAWTQGARHVLYPRENVEFEGIPGAVTQGAAALGIAVDGVASVGEACELLGRRKCPVLPVRKRRVPVGAAVGTVAAVAVAAVALFGPQLGLWKAPVSPLRSRYFVSDGDFVLDALMREDARNVFKLQKEPFILDNEVLRFERMVYQKYFHSVDEFARLNGEYLGGMEGDSEGYRERFPGIKRFRKPPETFTFAGEFRKRDYRIPQGDDPQFYLEPERPENAPQVARIVHRKFPASLADRPFLARDPLSRDLIRSSPGVWDLVDLNIYMGDPVGCMGPSVPETVETLGFRPLKLVFVALENAGSEPITGLRYTVRALEARGSDALKVRTMPESEEALGRATAQDLPFPYETLAPGESVLIPLAVGLGGISQDEENTLSEEQLSTHDNGFYFDLCNPTRASNAPYHQSYLFGPQVRVDAVAYARGRGVDSRPLRRMSEQRVQVTWVTASGSCPFVFCQDAASGNWRNLGSVLVGHRSADNPGYERRPLPFRSGSLELRELEPETSYIDCAELEVVAADGSVRRLPALDSKLRSRDGRFLVLNRGEHARLTFEGENGPWARRALHVWGHYLPWSGKTPPSSRRESAEAAGVKRALSRK